MIDMLLGVPGKLKSVYDHLSTYLSSTRCAKIDNLDAAISTRAAAATALSSGTWTAAKAGYLDMAISGVFRIKSLQKVSISFNATVGSNTATITSVDTTKAIIIPLGFLAPSGLDYTDPDGLSHYWALTNATTVTLTRGGTLAGIASGYAQVIEWY